MSKGVQIAIGATLIAILLGWYAASNLEALGSYAYYQTLEEFRSEGVSGTLVRVHGYVVPGSIVRDVGLRQVRFAVQNDAPHAGGSAPQVSPVVGSTAEPLPVVFASLETPDLFKDGAEVVVEGRLEVGAEAAVFQADNVLAKCPSKFEAQRMEAASF